MQIIIKGRQMQVTPQLRQRIERKVQRISRLLNNEARVEVTIAEEKTRSANDRYSVQLALSGSSQPIRSEVSALNASTALDLVLDKVVKQLGRQKDRQKTVRRQQTPAIKVLSLTRSGHLASLEDEGEEIAIDHLASAVGEEDNERIWSRVMEIRRLPTQPMTDQEVIAQMEEKGDAFFPFFNEETNSVNVMYRLEQGGYGLLIPAMG
ncbi:ribosome-associated translation inhibitor RaiA [Ktedonosporobacter rubrisoli]|uniref:Ribosome-associated translation inhibitor RaiA n=1 Tax=Ktedonosporobacter rubrisoli TaxID=2509675 RepID=A0A4P6K1Z5_KTERU|nr:ribosome-associated translation inhibitor RaiA [Ktedonosporobacter rubrisoli]QBD82144.1 ribosome-associated translation inhibitor RaiA [Ktedonosporobacter rubrisoli]